MKIDIDENLSIDALFISRNEQCIKMILAHNSTIFNHLKEILLKHDVQFEGKAFDTIIASSDGIVLIFENKTKTKLPMKK